MNEEFYRGREDWFDNSFESSFVSFYSYFAAFFIRILNNTIVDVDYQIVVQNLFKNFF